MLQLHLCLEVLINCASDPSNLPAFNTCYDRSDAIISVLPLTHGQNSSIALSSKMFLSLLNPLLECEQLGTLKLSRTEATACVSLLNIAFVTPHHMVQGSTLLTLLKVMIRLTHEYHRKCVKTMDEKKWKKWKRCSDYEQKLLSVSIELKSNIQLLVEGGILWVLERILNSSLRDEIKVTAIQLLWSLAHSGTAKPLILENLRIIKALEDVSNHVSSPEMIVASHCAIYLLGLQTEGNVVLKYKHV